MPKLGQSRVDSSSLGRDPYLLLKRQDFPSEPLGEIREVLNWSSLKTTKKGLKAWARVYKHSGMRLSDNEEVVSAVGRVWAEVRISVNLKSRRGHASWFVGSEVSLGPSQIKKKCSWEKSQTREEAAPHPKWTPGAFLEPWFIFVHFRNDTNENKSFMKGLNMFPHVSKGKEMTKLRLFRLFMEMLYETFSSGDYVKRA